MTDEKINEYCEKIASYLYCEGLFFDEYTLDEAILLLDKTCLPTALKSHLKTFENKVCKNKNLC